MEQNKQFEVIADAIINESNKILKLEDLIYTAMSDDPKYIIKANTDYLKAGIKSLYDAKIISTPFGITLEEMDTNYIYYGVLRTGDGNTHFDNINYDYDIINKNSENNIWNKLINDGHTDIASTGNYSCKVYIYDRTSLNWINIHIYTSHDPYIELTNDYLIIFCDVLLGKKNPTNSYKKLDDYLKTI